MKYIIIHVCVWIFTPLSPDLRYYILIDMKFVTEFTQISFLFHSQLTFTTTKNG